MSTTLPKQLQTTVRKMTHTDRNTVHRRGRIGSVTYAQMLNGEIRRLEPDRPWRGKSERRRRIAERRAEREAIAHV
jgi:hypothetical protein